MLTSQDFQTKGPQNIAFCDLRLAKWSIRKIGTLDCHGLAARGSHVCGFAAEVPFNRETV